MPTYHAASVYFLVISEKSSTFAADFKTYFAMSKSFKKISRLAQVLLIVLLCVSCAVGGPLDDIAPTLQDSFVADLSSSVQNKDRDRVFRDTITPPSNPMNEVPYVPGTHFFRGVLQLEYFGGSLFCAIRSTNNNYFLTDDGSIYLMRLNHPMLEKFAVGDTVVVTAMPMMVKDSLSLATYHILPNAIFK